MIYLEYENRQQAREEDTMKRFDVSDSDFEAIRQNDKYYVDKTLFIQEFIEQNERITLITRPRRFGKTTAMTMLADFFDMRKDSMKRFAGLKIMDTEYASLINTLPVIFLSFRECDGTSAENLRLMLNGNLFQAMSHLKSSLGEAMNQKSDNVRKFLLLLELFLKKEGSYADIADALDMMIRICYECDGMQPLVLIDEYDQPLLASHVNGYHREVKEFLSAFYTKALKDNPYIYRAVMTGIQYFGGSLSGCSNRPKRF